MDSAGTSSGSMPGGSGTSTQVFEHGLKIVGPAVLRTGRAGSPDLARGAKQRQQQQLPPWDERKNINLSRVRVCQ